jgi:uncharacterized protein YeaO (DUF488 family)
MHDLQIKRVYEKPDFNDGYRILIDRLWPRGMRKDEARLDDWAKAQKEVRSCPKVFWR